MCMVLAVYYEDGATEELPRPILCKYEILITANPSTSSEFTNLNILLQELYVGRLALAVVLGCQRCDD